MKVITANVSSKLTLMLLVIHSIILSNTVCYLLLVDTAIHTTNTMKTLYYFFVLVNSALFSQSECKFWLK